MAEADGDGDWETDSDDDNGFDGLFGRHTRQNQTKSGKAKQSIHFNNNDDESSEQILTQLMAAMMGDVSVGATRGAGGNRKTSSSSGKGIKKNKMAPKENGNVNSSKKIESVEEAYSSSAAKNRLGRENGAKIPVMSSVDKSDGPRIVRSPTGTNPNASIDKNVLGDAVDHCALDLAGGDDEVDGGCLVLDVGDRVRFMKRCSLIS